MYVVRFETDKAAPWDDNVDGVVCALLRRGKTTKGGDMSEVWSTDTMRWEITSSESTTLVLTSDTCEDCEYLHVAIGRYLVGRSVIAHILPLSIGRVIKVESLCMYSTHVPHVGAIVPSNLKPTFACKYHMDVGTSPLLLLHRYGVLHTPYSILHAQAAR